MTIPTNVKELTKASVQTSTSTTFNNNDNNNDKENNKKQTLLGFWLMGLLNNAAYVVMIAGAKSISEGGTGLVFIMNILPSLLVKLSAPYWFHLISYKPRIYASACFFSMSFGVVAYYSDVDGKNVEAMELLGVAFSAIGSGLGEASLLALAGRYDAKGSHITAFSSGTGLAGVFGFFWVELFHNWIGFSFAMTLMIANILSIGYAFTFRFLLFPSNGYEEIEPITEEDEEKEDQLELNIMDSYDGLKSNINHNSRSLLKQDMNDYDGLSSTQTDDDHLLEENVQIASSTSLQHLDVDNMSIWDRTRLVFSLWPYMIPLFAVYVAEYALQSGAWTSIGFPVNEVKARNSFYENGNWLYQAGVFVSRSSGSIYQASIRTLWILPIIQIANLIFFIWTAVTHVWYNESLLLFCFGAGLIGGGVYVNAYTRINCDLPSHQREFALASASVADSFGILVADIAGLFIQSCLYQANSIKGAAVTCPL